MGVTRGLRFGVDPSSLSAAHRGSMTDDKLTFALTDAEMHGPLERLNLQACAYTPHHFTLPDSRDHFDLDPPYQRGTVWDTLRRQRLIRSLLLGSPTGSIIINDRLLWQEALSAGGPMYAVVDGKQRILALRAFEDSEFSIPATWVPEADRPADAGDFVVFEQLSLPWRRRWVMWPLSTYQATVGSIEAEAEVFRLVNTGGVEQTADDLGRAAAIEHRI